MAELDVDEMLARYRKRADAVKQRGIPPIEGEGRGSFITQAEHDFMDYSLVGAAAWSVEGEHLVLRIPLA